MTSTFAEAGASLRPPHGLSRRTFLAATVPALASACTGRGGALRLRVATNLAPSHAFNRRLGEAAERIARASGGQVLLELYPASQLGGDSDMLSQVRFGAIDFLSISGIVASTLVPEAALSGVSFAFHDRAQLFAALDGPVGRVIRDAFARHDLYAFPHAFENGFRQITTSRIPVRTPADLKGLKIRVPVGSLFSSTFRAFGATPTSLNFSETYTALQTHVVDGQENPLAIVSTFKLYEVQRYCSMTDHMWDGFWMLTNRERFARLPRDVRDLLHREFERVAMLERADLAALSATLPAELGAAGMTITTPDRQAFRATLSDAGFYRQLRERLGEGVWRTLEGATGGLA